MLLDGAGASANGYGRQRQKHLYNSEVHFEERDGGWPIQMIDPDTEASISGMAAEAFDEHAQDAKNNCPVSRALSGVDIHLRAKLL